MRRLLRWLRLFPAIVFPNLCLKNYLKVVRRGMKKYDMLGSPSEDYFRDRYMHIIDAVLESQNLRYDKLKVLDVGCGQGRLSFEFLKRASAVDALDAVPELLDRAKFFAREANLDTSSLRWIEGQIPEALLKLPNASYDLIICTEVLYMVPDPQESIKKMVELLLPGGILVISLRTRLYYLLYSLINNDSLGLHLAFEDSNYQSIGKSLSWVDPDDMVETFRSLKLKEVNKWGIGLLTGIDGDPTAKFCKPYTLNSADKLFLAKVEDRIGSIYSDAGRYIVFSGIKEGKLGE